MDAERIAEGFKVISLKLKGKLAVESNRFYLFNGLDADTKQIFMDEPEWGTQQEAFDAANKAGSMREVHFPAAMLSAKALSREVVFSSTEAIKELKLVQKMYLHD